MKFTKIFDVTERDSDAPQSQSDGDANQAFDNPDMILHDDDEQDIIQHDLEVLLPESMEIMGDHDWTCAEIKVDEINSDALEHEDQRLDLSPTGSTSSIESMDSFYKPEADQSEHEQNLSEHVANALRRDARAHDEDEWLNLAPKISSSYLIKSATSNRWWYIAKVNDILELLTRRLACNVSESQREIATLTLNDLPCKVRSA